MVFSDVCRVYAHGDKYLVLNPLVPSWIVTNINGVLLLKLFAEDKSYGQVADEFRNYAPTFSQESLIGFLRKANETHLFDIPNKALVHKPYSLNGVYLNMTEACNLHCIYCFAAERIEQRQKLTFADYEMLIAGVVEINPNAEIMFTGGEPLLSKLTLPVAHLAKNKGLRCKLMTNGTLIDETNVDAIAEAFDTVRVSIDGSSEEIHEFYRGKGTYQRTENAVNLLISNGTDVALAMVVTKHNRSDVLSMAKKWGSRLTFQPLFPLGDAKTHKDLYLSGEEYFEALTIDGYAGIVPYANLGDLIERHKENESLMKCAMGDGEISISCTGDVYPCQLLHVPDYCVGNIKDKSLQEIYYSDRLSKFQYHTVLDIDKCAECDLRLLCGGSCQARHYSETGSIDCTGEFCSYERKSIIDGLIKSAVLQEL